MARHKDGKLIPYSEWCEADKQQHRARVAKLGAERKVKLVALSGGRCTRCGYDRSLRSLCFHHRSDKRFALTAQNLKRYSWDEIMEEHAKCDLVCANCHGEIHDELKMQM